ncbi:hypothetical protein MRS44_017880 [Fusarium solani]|uniref:uncharacterized protein n=1 Tax=Fusarium solani TaxID=169388 RepID=UPI0032C3FFB7|nr:hypothetical protein MRS44_017880 [Fusarium solani]
MSLVKPGPVCHGFHVERQPGTCQWLLDSVEYHNWVENGSQILYCPGIPGGGKTVVSSIVIHDLEIRFAADTTVGLAHIYCNSENQQNQDIRMLLASVLKQLCQRRPAIPDAVKSLHGQHIRLQTKPRIEELSKAIETVSALFQRIYLVVDALDEWKDIEADRSLMLRELLSIQAKTGLNLFATSRPVLDIKKTLHGYTSVEISASRADVALYIDGHKHMLPGFVGETPGLLNKINDTLFEASQGICEEWQDRYQKMNSGCGGLLPPPEQYKRFDLKATAGCPLESSLSRTALHHLLAARSLHGDFAAYHGRFDHSKARLVCACNRLKTLNHIFYYRKIPPRHRMRLAPSPNAAVNLAIGKDFTKFVKLSKSSAFSDNICPRC